MDLNVTDPALMRELDVIGDRRRGISGVFPVSRSEWRAGIREGRYPKPIKIPGKALSFWKRSEVLAMLAKIAEGQK
jgi:prophage regulatory protein